MRYRVSNAANITTLGAAVRDAVKAGPLIVDVQTEADVRTKAQNRRYWASIVGSLQDWMAMPENGGQAHSREMIHAYLKTEVLGGDVAVINGRVTTASRASRNMTRQRFGEYVDAAEAHIIDIGVPPEMIAGYGQEIGDEH